MAIILCPGVSRAGLSGGPRRACAGCGRASCLAPTLERLRAQGLKWHRARRGGGASALLPPGRASGNSPLLRL